MRTPGGLRFGGRGGWGSYKHYEHGPAERRQKEGTWTKKALI